MNIVKIIEKKIAKKELTKEELDWVFESYEKKQIKDYQMTSFLMTILFNGLTNNELINYTKLLINSGEKIFFDDLDLRVDKHSTGGVGDKVSLILSPILAANGIKVGKISGRGLGHTGGTIDKLESIPNFSVDLKLDEFINFSKKDGISIMNTSSNFSPLDKKIYALRDVSGTVSSNHLIAASIMAKKLLINSKYIFIDLKIGSASLFQNIEDAKETANLMKMLANEFNREIYIVFSTMDQPLGNYVGNSLEVYETIEILKNNLKNDAYDLVIYFSSIIISKLKNISLEDSKALAINSIKNGSAYKKFETLILNQKGNLKLFNSKNHFNTKYNYVIKAEKDGFLKFINTINFGYGLVELGGGRKEKNDIIDHEVGFKIIKKNNQKISKDDDLIIIYSNNKLEKEFIDYIKNSYLIVEKPFEFNQIIKEISW